MLIQSTERFSSLYFVVNLSFEKLNVAVEHPPMFGNIATILNHCQVLTGNERTYASDIYSFGIVAWEVLSRELPWANVKHANDIFIRVVLNNLRPDIPADAPADLGDMVKACWASDQKARPTFGSVLNGIKANGWKGLVQSVDPSR